MSLLRLENDLLNYWNLKQVIYLRGVLNKGFKLDPFCRNLVEAEYIQSYDCKFPDDLDASLMRQSDQFNTSLDGKVNEKRVRKEIEEVQKLGLNFEKLVDQLAMPLRLSIMVLVSVQRVQVFEP